MNISSRISPRTSRTAGLAATMAVVLWQLAPLSNAAEPAYMKDLEPIQKPMAKLQPVSPSATNTSGAANTTSAGGLVVKTAVDRPDGRYRHGDTLTLTVDVTEDAYVWVFDTGTSGKVHQIFPNQYESDNFVRAGNAVAIPSGDSDYQLQVSHPKGTELLTVIASKDKISLTRDLIDKNTEAGPFLALLGDAVSVAKDLSITLKKKPANQVVHNHVIYIE